MLVLLVAPHPPMQAGCTAAAPAPSACHGNTSVPMRACVAAQPLTLQVLPERLHKLAELQVLESHEDVVGAERLALLLLADVVGRRRDEADEDLGARGERSECVLVHLELLLVVLGSGHQSQLRLDNALDERAWEVEVGVGLCLAARGLVRPRASRLIRCLRHLRR